MSDGGACPGGSTAVPGAYKSLGIPRGAFKNADIWEPTPEALLARAGIFNSLVFQICFQALQSPEVEKRGEVRGMVGDGCPGPLTPQAWGVLWPAGAGTEGWREQPAPQALPQPLKFIVAADSD